MSNAPLWLEITRGVLVGLAGVILGMTVQVFAVYGMRAKRHGGLLPMHVACISGSYALLIIATGGTQAELLVSGADLTWRVPIITVAYVLGILALRLVIVHAAQQLAAVEARKRARPGGR